MVAFLENREPDFASPQYIADNSATPAHILHELATSCDVGVRMAVADNRNSLVPTVMLLALDQDSDLRYALAENHNIDAKVLELLSDDTNPYVASRAKRTLVRLGEVTKSKSQDSIAVLFGMTSPHTLRSISRRIS